MLPETLPDRERSPDEPRKVVCTRGILKSVAGYMPAEPPCSDRKDLPNLNPSYDLLLKLIERPRFTLGACGENLSSPNTTRSAKVLADCVASVVCRISKSLCERSR